MGDIHGRAALILAGGMGLRLRPAVSDRPKPMALVAGRPFLEALFEQLIHYGYRHAVLCVGYRAEQVKAGFGDAYGALTLDYSVEEQPLGTGGALRHAIDRIRSEQVLVMNGDSYCEMDLESFAQFHLRQSAEATIAVLHREDRHRSGAVELDADGRVTQFAVRPIAPSPGLINAGIYMMRRHVVHSIAPGRFVSLEEEVFLPLSQRGQLFGYRAGAEFIDIGTPESYQAAQGLFFRK